MADVVSPAKRRQMMSSIKGKDSAPEMRVRKVLFAMGPDVWMWSSTRSSCGAALPQLSNAAWTTQALSCQEPGLPHRRLTGTGQASTLARGRHEI